MKNNNSEIIIRRKIYNIIQEVLNEILDNNGDTNQPSNMNLEIQRLFEKNKNNKK